MGKKQDNLIARHVLEIRLKNRSLSFMDFKGEMGDFIIKKMGWNKLKVTGTRVEITNDDLSKIFFFSWENFGLQIEASKNFDEFNEYVKKLFEIIKDFKRYKIDDIARLGTKSSVFYHRKNMSFEGTKQIFKNIMFKDVSSLETKMGGNIIDTGIFALDIDCDKSKINFTSGAMQKNEVIEKIFQNNLYDDFIKDNGIYFDFDLYLQAFTPENIHSIEEKVLENIKAIEEKMGGFLEYFFSLKQ